MVEPRPRINMSGFRKILGVEGRPVSRATVYRRMDDPNCPKPLDGPGQLEWFRDEAVLYVNNRRRRQYTKTPAA